MGSDKAGLPPVPLTRRGFSSSGLKGRGDHRKNTFLSQGTFECSLPDYVDLVLSQWHRSGTPGSGGRLGDGPSGDGSTVGAARLLPFQPENTGRGLISAPGLSPNASPFLPPLGRDEAGECWGTWYRTPPELGDPRPCAPLVPNTLIHLPWKLFLGWG